MLNKHFETLPIEQADNLIAGLKLAIETDNAKRVAEIMRTPGFPGTLRACVGSGRTGDGSKNELRLLFEGAMEMAGENAGPDAWLWLAAAGPYRDMDIDGVRACNERAVTIAAEGAERNLVMLIGLHNLAATWANVRKWLQRTTCTEAVAMNRGIVDALTKSFPELLNHETARLLLLKAQYGIIIHSQWSEIPGDYAAEYAKLERFGRERNLWDVVTAALRERGKILAAKGNVTDARTCFEQAIAVANEHGYAWHYSQAQAELDKLKT